MKRTWHERAEQPREQQPTVSKSKKQWRDRSEWDEERRRRQQQKQEEEQREQEEQSERKEPAVSPRVEKPGDRRGVTDTRTGGNAPRQQRAEQPAERRTGEERAERQAPYAPKEPKPEKPKPYSPVDALVESAAPQPEAAMPTMPPAVKPAQQSDPRYGAGNIDLYDRDTKLYDEDGNLMTVRSMSFNEDGKEILVPTIVKRNGEWVKLTDDEAIDWYHKTGEYLGKFDTIEEADAYAEKLHEDQADMYVRPNGPAPASQPPAASKPAYSPPTSLYSSFMDDESQWEGGVVEQPETPEEAAAMPRTALDDYLSEQEALRQAGAGQTAAAQQEQKEQLKQEREALEAQYNDLKYRFMYGRIWAGEGAPPETGVWYTPEEAQQMVTMETQLRDYDEKIAALQADVNAGQALGTNIMAGLERAGLGVTQGLDWLAGENSLPWDFAKEVGTLFGLDLEGKNPVTALRNRGEEEVAYWADRGAESVAGNDTWESVGQHAQSIAQSSPFIVLNLLTLGGAGGAAATTEGLGYLSNLFQSSGMQGISAMARQGMQTLASNPSAQYAFATTFGSSYDEALKDGATPAEATLYAVLNGTFNSMIEVGGADAALGGMQALPAEVQKAIASGDRNFLLKWIKSTVGEINEEEWQGFIERGLKSIYTDVPLYSTEDQNAIFNPQVVADTAKNTFIDAGIMGGGQMAAQYGMNALANAGQNRQAEQTEPLAPDAALAEAATPAEVAGIPAPDTSAEVTPLMETLAEATGTAPAAPVGDTRMSGIDRAEAAGPEVTAQAAELRDGAAGLRASADALEAAAETSPAIADMRRSFLDQASRMEEEAARLEREAATASKATAPANPLADTVAEAAETAPAGEEAAEGISVPPQGAEGDTAQSDEFNTAQELREQAEEELSKAEALEQQKEDLGEDAPPELDAAIEEANRNADELAQQAEQVEQQAEGQAVQPVTENAEPAPEGAVPTADGGAILPDGAKISQYWSNTLNTIEEAANAPDTVKNPLWYMPKSEAQSLAEAASRLNEDTQGTVESLVDAEAWSGVQHDAAAMVADQLYQQAAESGDWTAYAAWRKVMQNHITATAQGLQSVAKYTRHTGAKAVDDAISALDDSDLPKPVQNEVLSDIGRFASEFDAIPEGDVDALRAFIMKLAEHRGTWTLIKGNLGKFLDKQSESWLREAAYLQLEALPRDAMNVGMQNSVAKFAALQFMNMLSGMPTIAGNVVSNTGFGTLDMLSTYGPGRAWDALLGNITGQRTDVGSRGPAWETIPQWFKNAWTNMRRNMLEIALDIDMDGRTRPYEQSANSPFIASGNMIERLFHKWDQTLKYALTSTDRFTRGGTETGEVENLNAYDTKRESKGKSGTNLTAEEKEAIAQDRADYRLFQRKGNVTEGAKQIRTAVNNMVGVGGETDTLGNITKDNTFGLGTMGMRFVEVPTNLPMVGLDYGPVGLIKGIRETARLWKLAAQNNATTNEADKVSTAVLQSRAASDMGRGLTGSALLVLSTLLAKAGIIRHAGDDKDYDANAVDAQTGLSGSQINLSAIDRWINGESKDLQEGDLLVGINRLSPFNYWLNAGVALSKLEELNFANAAEAYMQSALETTLEIPMFAALKDMESTLRDAESFTWGTVGDLAGDFLDNQMGALVPQFIRQGAKAADPYYRDTASDSWLQERINNAIQYYPWLRGLLDPQIDSFGEPKEQAGTALQQWINSEASPVTFTSYAPTDVTELLASARAETDKSPYYPNRKPPKSIDFSDGSLMTADFGPADETHFDLNTAESRAYQTVYGQTYTAALQALSETGELWEGLSPEDKKKTLTRMESYATDAAKRAFAESRGLRYSSSWNKTNSVLDTGVPLGQYLIEKSLANEDGSGTLKVGELYTWLANSDYTERQKSAIWDANYTGNSSWKEYYDSHPVSVLTKAGLSPEDAEMVHFEINANGDSKLSQNELWTYYHEHPDSETEGYVKALWEAAGFQDGWDAYKGSQESKPQYVLESAGLSTKEAEAMLTAIRPDGKKPTQDHLYSYYLEHPEDEQYVEAIWNASGWSGSDTATWEKYKASLAPAEQAAAGAAEGAASSPHSAALVEAGMSQEDADELFTALDASGDGKPQQKEIKTYYKEHPEQKEYLKALWDSMGWKTGWEP